MAWQGAITRCRWAACICRHTAALRAALLPLTDELHSWAGWHARPVMELCSCMATSGIGAGWDQLIERWVGAWWGLHAV